MSDEKYARYDLQGDKDNYEWALEQAGATIHAFKNFGSYQGHWYAKITYGGNTGWIKDSYGSCSGCDAFQYEVGWGDRTKDEWKEWCERFAKIYLEAITSWEDVYQTTKEDAEWDYDAKEALKFLEGNKYSSPESNTEGRTHADET